MSTSGSERSVSSSLTVIKITFYFFIFLFGILSLTLLLDTDFDFNICCSAGSLREPNVRTWIVQQWRRLARHAEHLLSAYPLQLGRRTPVRYTRSIVAKVVGILRPTVALHQSVSVGVAHWNPAICLRSTKNKRNIYPRCNSDMASVSDMSNGKASPYGGNHKQSMLRAEDFREQETCELSALARDTNKAVVLYGFNQLRLNWPLRILEHPERVWRTRFSRSWRVNYIFD
jgi:hypothetical protein